MPQIGQIFRLRRAFPPYKFPNKFPNTPKFFRLRRAFPLPNLSSESRALFCDSKGCPQMRFAAPDFRFFPPAAGWLPMAHRVDLSNVHWFIQYNTYNILRRLWHRKTLCLDLSVYLGTSFFPGLRPKFIDQKNLDGNKGEQSLRRRGDSRKGQD